MKASPTSPSAPRWFTAAALVFAGWGALSTGFSLYKYGWESGIYYWFCNLSLFAVACGLWFRSRNALVAVAAALLFTQGFWLLDNGGRILTGNYFLGLVEFLYQPGMPLPEYLLSQYHYFPIPVALFAAYHLPRSADRTLWFLIPGAAALFLPSYFLFPESQNVNCAHEPCFPALESWEGPVYSLLFPVLVSALAGLIARSLWRLPTAAESGITGPRLARGAFVVALALSTVLIAGGTYRKATSPRFACGEPFEDSLIRIRCRYTTEYQRDLMLLVYEITNKRDIPQECTSRMGLHGKFEVLHDGVFLQPRQKVPVSVLVPYPSEDMTVRLVASCHR